MKRTIVLLSVLFSLSATASANPTSGQITLNVQFTGSAAGGMGVRGRCAGRERAGAAVAAVRTKRRRESMGLIVRAELAIAGRIEELVATHPVASLVAAVSAGMAFAWWMKRK